MNVVSAARVAIALVLLPVAETMFAGMTLDEDFGGVPLVVGASDSGRSYPAGELLGDNCGSVFFDVVFSAKPTSGGGMRTIVTISTTSRLTLGWNLFDEGRLRFLMTDRDRSYGCELVAQVELGRTYACGVTWNGSVVRVYLDGVCIHSGVQPIPLKKAIVNKLNLGPYEDGYYGKRVWKEDVAIRGVRVFDEAREPKAVADEAGVSFQKLVKTHHPLLSVTRAPVRASLPQLIRCDNPGETGATPPLDYRLSYDEKGVYFDANTLFPAHVSMIEGQVRTPDNETEVWGSESWELYFFGNGHAYRFAANVAGGTCEALDGDNSQWNVPWRFEGNREMKIDDSVLWVTKSFLPWAAIGCKGVPRSSEPWSVNFGHNWTLSTYGGCSSLDLDGIEYRYVESMPTLTFGAAAGFGLVSRTDPAEGEYRQESTVTAAEETDVEYRLSLARLDGSLAPFVLYSRRRHLAEGDTATDTIDVRTDVPGYDAILHELVADEKVVMREIVPYALSMKLFDVTPLLLQEKVRVKVSKPVAGEIRLIGPGNRIAASRACERGTYELPFPRTNTPGTWKVVLADGTVVLGEKAFDYPGIGAWEKQDFHEDWIIPPFKPMTVEKEENGFKAAFSVSESAWKGAWPKSVVAAGEELLAEPTALIADGKEVGPLDVGLETVKPHRITWTAADADRSLVSKGWLEYDGVNWNEVAYTPSVPMGSLELKCVFKASEAKYLHMTAGASWGVARTEKIEEGVREYGPFTTFWVGGEERGYCLFYETRADWTSESAKMYCVEKRGNTVAVSMKFAKDMKPGVPFTFAFGLQPTPMRPKAANYPFDTLGWAYSAPLNRPEGHPVMDIAFMTLDGFPHSDLGSFLADLPDEDGRRHAEGIRQALKWIKPEWRIRPICYGDAMLLSIRYPEVSAYLSEWRRCPEEKMDYDKTGHFVHRLCPATTANDFMISRVREYHRRFPGLKGVYYDFGLIGPCSNPEHGCRDRTPILGMREFYRRSAIVQMETGIANPAVTCHITDCIQPPVLSFVAAADNGEQLRQSSSTTLHNKKDVLDTIPVERFAVDYSSLPWGVSSIAYMPHDRLTEENGGDEPAAAYQFRVGKASLGACLVHGTIHGLSRNHYGLFDKVVRALDAFGVNRDMMFVGWWKKPVKVLKGEDVYVSTWKDEREGKRLLVIAHLGKPHVDQDVELEIVGRTALDKLTAPDTDYDFLYRRMKEFNVPALRAQLDLGDFGTKVISYDGKTLTYRLPFHSFGIVEVK